MENYPTTTSDNRFSETGWAILSALRFVLAFIVICGHSRGAGWFCGAIQPLNDFTAVVCFFVISGFSIAHSITQKPNGYVPRRINRIYPVYLASLLYAYAAYSIPGVRGITGFSHAPATATFIAALVMLQGIVTPTFDLDGPLWSLAYEWWLYMVAPVLKKCSAVMLVLLAFISVYCAIAFEENLFPNGANRAHYGYFVGLLPIAWAWISGFALRRYWGNKLVELFVWIASGAYVGLYFGYPAIITMLVTLFVVRNAFDVQPLASKLQTVMTWLGDVSYPIYTTHAVTAGLIFGLFHSTADWLYLSSAIGVGFLVLVGVDLPVRRLARRSAAKLPRATEAAPVPQPY